jgi:hypothetical protein
MSPVEAVLRGARAVLRARRMALLFWLYTLAFALAGVLPALALLYGSLGHSLYAYRLLDNFDIQWVAEMLYATRGVPVDLFAMLAAVLGAGYVLLSTFLAGGAVTVFASPEGRYRPGLFYEGCGRNFGRLFRLLLVSLVVYGLVLAANAGLATLSRRVWGQGMEERPLVIFGWFRTGVTILLLLVVNMIFDYAKIGVVVEDQQRASRAAMRSTGLVFRNFGRAGTTYGMVALAVVLLAVVGGALTGILPRNEAVWMGLLLVLQQALILGRIGIKLLFFASQLEMYRGMTPAVESESGAGAVEVGEEPEYLI